MTRRLSNSGFTVVEVTIILFVAVALGLGSFFVWKHTQKDKHKTATTSTSTKQSATSENSSDKTTQADPSEGGKYLVIKEWGVRFALPQDLQGDVEYGIRKNVGLTDDDSAPMVYGDVAYFASKRLEAIPSSSNNCGLRPGGHDDLNDRYDPTSYDGGPGVDLSRSTSRPEPRGGIQIDGYWYGASHGGAAACYEGSDGTQESAFISEIMRALTSVTAIPE